MATSSLTRTLATASDALAALRANLVAEYVRQAKLLYGSLTPGDWWNDAVVVAASGRLALLEMSMLQQARRAGLSYADTILKLMGVTPRGNLDGFVYPRVNTDPWQVAMRPAMLYRHLQAQRPDVKPKTWPDSDSEIGQVVSGWLEDAYRLLEDEATTDATAASNQASVDRYRDSGVGMYRRIVHPERSRTGTCGLCLVAADRTYSTGNLLPLHNRCKCTTAPVTDKDPGLNLTDEDLENLYFEARGRTRADLSNIRVKTITHGELGPILTRNDTKTDGTTSWEPPTDGMTRETIARMRDHSLEFARRYRQLLDSDMSFLEFRFDGKSYTFRKSTHTREAMEWNSRIAENLAARMSSLAAR